MKEKNLRKKNKIASNAWQVYLLGAIPLLYLFIFNYLPMGGLVIAFKDYRYDKGIFGSDWVGFKNFEFFFTSNEFVKITRNTLLLNFLFIFMGIVCAVIVAMFLFDLKSRTKTKVFQTVMITPHFLSWVVVSFMAYGFLSPSNGFINTLLVNLGMDKIEWYSEPSVWPFILTFFSIWKHIGMDSVIYYAALMGLDNSYFEAAEIDGATNLQIKWNIVLPSLVPLITILSITKIGGIFRADFGLFYQVTRDVGALYPTTDVIDTYIFRTMRELGDMGMSSAVGFLQSVVGLIMVVITNAIVKKIEPDNAMF